MKKVLIVMFMFLPMVASAFTGKAEINGIWYYIVTKGQTAEVTNGDGNTRYTGDIIIPEAIEYEGVTCYVTSIGDYAFQNCSGLKSITLPDGIASIGRQAFQFCESLTSIPIPTNLSNIGEGAFQYCSNLKSFYIKDLASWCKISFGTNSVYAFHLYLNGEEIKDLVIPNSVTSISNNAFQYNEGLVSLTIPDGVSSIGNRAFYSCTNIMTINIGNSLISIGESAFHGCKGLTSVKMGDGVRTIDGFAFYECSNLSTISIGKNISSIGRSAFTKCSELTDFYCYAENAPNAYSNDFSGSYIEYATLHVPASSVEKYKSREPWKYFKNIVAIDENVPETQKCSVPIISYANGKLTFTCDTEGVIFLSRIENSDIRSYSTNEVQLTASYRIIVYATKEGFDNSDVAIATLCWLETEPKTEGMANNISETRGNAILIQSKDGLLSIDGVENNSQITVYTVSGQMVGSVKAQGERLTIATGLRNGELAIVKIGNKSVKIIMR